VVRLVRNAGVVLVVAACSLGAWQEDADPGRVIGNTLRDLREAKPRTAFSHVQQERLHQAISELQDLADRHKKDGALDKPKLDEAIEDVAFVIQRDPIQESVRVSLERDVARLRRLREASAMQQVK
jgi:hypothetical protein